MADLLERFRILADSSGNGQSPDEAVNATTDPTGKRGLIGFSFKDADGKVVLPQLTSDGKVPVSMAGVGTVYYDNGEVAAGSSSLVEIASLTLSLNKLYVDICAQGCALHSSLFQVVYVNNAEGTPVETIVAEFIVGAGQFSYEYNCKMYELDTSSGTGVQKLVLKAKNFAAQTSLRGNIACREI